MDDLRREMSLLHRRMRLMTLGFFGALSAAVFALGGADVVASVLIGDGWKIRTNDSRGVPTDRLEVTAGSDLAAVRVSNANLELAQQPLQPSTTTPGSLWFDSAAQKLKYRTTGGWIDTSSGGRPGEPSPADVPLTETFVRKLG